MYAACCVPHAVHAARCVLQGAGLQRTPSGCMLQVVYDEVVRYWSLVAAPTGNGDSLAISRNRFNNLQNLLCTVLFGHDWRRYFCSLLVFVELREYTTYSMSSHIGHLRARTVSMDWCAHETARPPAWGSGRACEYLLTV